MKLNLLYIVRKLNVLVAANYLWFFASVKYDAIRRVPTEAIAMWFYVIEYVKNFKLSMNATNLLYRIRLWGCGSRSRRPCWMLSRSYYCLPCISSPLLLHKQSGLPVHILYSSGESANTKLVAYSWFRQPVWPPHSHGDDARPWLRRWLLILYEIMSIFSHYQAYIPPVSLLLDGDDVVVVIVQVSP